MMLKKVLIIAEAGVNHNGDINLAKEMIIKAKEAGADIVKFQTGRPELLISRYAPKAEYQSKNTRNYTENQLEMCKKFELRYQEFEALKRFCEDRSIRFASTPFESESIDFLNGIGMDIWKIPSGEITNLPLLIKIAKLKKQVILSTGMSTIEEVKFAVSTLRRYGTKDIIILHCNTAYPTPYEDVNLSAMSTLKQEFLLPVGYSDHTKGIIIPIAAVAMGAIVIEKHFTLDRNMPGPDHKASLEPEELKEMISAIRNIELAMGEGMKVPSKSELVNLYAARKSIVAKVNIKKGEIFTNENLTTKRPGNGISPTRWFNIIGQNAKRNYIEDELIDIE